jgi:tetratricopeptide (TPR) repeat protein
MFSRYIRCLQQTSLVLFACLGLIAVPQANADAFDVAKTCFNFHSAQDYARAESEAKRLVKRKGLSREEQRYAYLCLGRAYIDTGRNQAALPTFQQVETLSRTTEELATAYNFLGSTYANLNDLDRAEWYDQRALKAYRELGYKSNEAATLNNLAQVVEKRGDVDRALALYQEALALEPDEAQKPSILNNIAMIYSSRKEYDKAADMLRQALEIARRNGNAHGTAMYQLNLGNILYRSGKLEAAEVELMAGLNAIRLVGDKDWEAAACMYLAWLEKAKQDTRAAKQWYAKAEKFYREIGDVSGADKMAADAAKFGGK